MYCQILGEEKFWSASSIDCPTLQVREEYKLNEYRFSFISPSPIYVLSLSLSLSHEELLYKIESLLAWNGYLVTTMWQIYDLEKNIKFKDE